MVDFGCSTIVFLSLGVRIANVLPQIPQLPLGRQPHSLHIHYWRYPFGSLPLPPISPSYNPLVHPLINSWSYYS